MNEWELKLQIILGDISILLDFKIYLAITNNSNTVNVIYSITLVLSPYQIGNK